MASLSPKFIIKPKVKGIDEAKEIIFRNCSTDCVLFLSGGSTPKPLYEELSKTNKLQLGAGAIVDERFGEPMHANSNEKMIADTNLLQYFKDDSIRFFPVLKDKDIIGTTEDYDETVRWLLYHFNKSIGILGIGKDGHIAGLAPGTNSPEYIKQNKHNMAVYLDNFPGPFPERITMSFLALSMLDLIIVLAFGKEKKKALKNIFSDGPIEEMPVRFFAQKGVAEKTIIITDQNI